MLMNVAKLALVDKGVSGEGNNSSGKLATLRTGGKPAHTALRGQNSCCCGGGSGGGSDVDGPEQRDVNARTPVWESPRHVTSEEGAWFSFRV